MAQDRYIEMLSSDRIRIAACCSRAESQVYNLIISGITPLDQVGTNARLEDTKQMYEATGQIMCEVKNSD